jgi:hypothetical protein
VCTSAPPLTLFFSASLYSAFPPSVFTSVSSLLFHSPPVPSLICVYPSVSSLLSLPLCLTFFHSRSVSLDVSPVSPPPCLPPCHLPSSLFNSSSPFVSPPPIFSLYLYLLYPNISPLYVFSTLYLPLNVFPSVSSPLTPPLSVPLSLSPLFLPS